MPELTEFFRKLLTVIYFAIFVSLCSSLDKKNKKSEKNKENKNKQDQKSDEN